VCPFKQTLRSSTFLWLRGLSVVLQNGFEEFFPASRIKKKRFLGIQALGVDRMSTRMQQTSSSRTSFQREFLHKCSSLSHLLPWRTLPANHFCSTGRWRYQESNFSLQMFLPCSSYSAFVTHILLRNTSVLDRATPPSHACVTGLKEGHVFLNNEIRFIEIF